MLEACLEIFERQPDIDKLILDTYAPAEGTYVIMAYENGQFVQKEWIEVKKDKKSGEALLTYREREAISRPDYYCKLVDMNKPVDPKKVIQSNSYLGFVIKKESLTNGKLTKEIITQYYNILRNPRIKYTKKQDIALYDAVEEQIGLVNYENIDIVEQWINKNIFSFAEKVTGKDYLKIFFQMDHADYETEGKRYYIPNIYNKNDYNVKSADGVYGLPNNNMGLNAKKPYLDHKDRKCRLPIMENSDKVMCKKKFFDYLMNLASERRYNVYLPIDPEKKITACKDDDENGIPNGFTGYKLRLKKEKNEAAIIDADYVMDYRDLLDRSFYMQNLVEVPEKYLEDVRYGEISKRDMVRKLVDEVFFSKYYLKNIYTEPKDMKGIKDSGIRKGLLLYRDAYTEWLDKGNDEADLIKVVKQSGDMLIHNAIENDYMIKVMHQFNLKWSLLEYFQESEGTMKNKLTTIRQELKRKMDADVLQDIESDEEYSYAAGQMLGYLIGLNKSSKKTFSLGNRYLALNKDAQLKEQLRQLFMRYDHDEDMYKYKKRVGNLLAMILAYDVEQAINHDLMLAGYVSNGVIFEKKQEEKADE